MGVLEEKEQANGTGWVGKQRALRRPQGGGRNTSCPLEGSVASDLEVFQRPDIGIPAGFPDRHTGMGSLLFTSEPSARERAFAAGNHGEKKSSLSAGAVTHNG